MGAEIENETKVATEIELKERERERKGDGGGWECERHRKRRTWRLVGKMTGHSVGTEERRAFPLERIIK